MNRFFLLILTLVISCTVSAQETVTSPTDKSDIHSSSSTHGSTLFQGYTPTVPQLQNGYQFQLQHNSYEFPAPVDSLRFSLRPNEKLIIQQQLYESSQLYDRTYSFGWKRSGHIFNMRNSFVSGSSSLNLMPGVGAIRNANLGYTQEFGKLSVSAGVTGTKYSLMGNVVGNSYGLLANINYRLNDRISFNAFGSKTFGGTFYSAAAMPYLPSTNYTYGAFMNYRFNDYLSTDVGVERYYDVYSRRWMTSPLVVTHLNVLGMDIPFNLGELFRSMIISGRNNTDRLNNFGEAHIRIQAPRPSGGGCPVLHEQRNMKNRR
jgi:hypothetical protein